MSQVISKPKTMSSREIAELTGKQHSHIRRDIKKMLEDIGFSQDGLVHEWTDPQNGQKYEEYQLDRRLTDCLLTGYSAKARLKVIDRWHELESSHSPAFVIPTTLSEALQLAADQAKQLEEQAPKIAVYEKLADRKGDVSTTIVAKQLGTTAVKLNRWLREIGVKWQNADLPKAGYMEWFNVVALDVAGDTRSQCLVTPVGQIEIAKRWGN